MRAEDDLAVGEVAVAGDVTVGAGEDLLVVLLQPVASVAVPVHEPEQVGRQRRTGGDAGQVRALRLLLEAHAGKVHRPELVRLGFRKAPLDVRELRGRLQGRQQRCLVHAQHGGEAGSHTVSVLGRDLVG